MDENTLVAYEMNGQPLPHFNGFPARLVVPGWTGTYWMKHSPRSTALTKPQGGFWMNPAYRIPLGKFPLVARFITQETRGQYANHRDGRQLADHQPCATARKVKAGRPSRSAASPGTAATASGRSKCRPTAARPGSPAKLGEDLGRFAFRTFELPVLAEGEGQANRDGECQQQDRADADVRADPQPGRLPPQRHSQRHIERGLRGKPCAQLLLHLVAALFAGTAIADEKPVQAQEGAGARQGGGQLRVLPQPGVRR